jgi:arylsulfatase A-like enzyme
MMNNAQKRPNILFLMTDQHRWDALGCVNPVVKTPNLDALAARGIRFTQSICNAPLCIPSRYSMMLGLYPSQCGVRHNTQMCPMEKDLPLPVLPQRLHHMGYQTAGFGKTHWYPGSEFTPDIPVQTSTRGFEVRAQTCPDDPKVTEPGAKRMVQDMPETFARLRAETAPFGGGGEDILGYIGCTSAVPAEAHREGWLTQQALDFLERDRDPDRPMLLYLSFDFPHPGFNVPAGFEELYNIEDVPERPTPPWTQQDPGHAVFTRFPDAWGKKTSLERCRTTLRYYALCSYVDGLFGRVLRKLDEIGELEDTFVIFVSDHGEMLGDRFHRFSKYSMYEGSVRIPIIVAGVGVPLEKQGTADDRYAELVDILPTVMHVAGESTPPGLPGHNLLAPSCRIGGFAEMHGGGYEPGQMAPTYMWRTRDWKLILHLPGEITDATTRLADIRGELYHLQDDPYEWYNLYDDPQHLAVRERLTRNLLMHVACAWAKYPRQVAGAQIE